MDQQAEGQATGSSAGLVSVREGRNLKTEGMAYDPADAPYVATHEQVSRWRDMSRTNNMWRRDSIKAFEYADGNQYDYELAEKYRRFDRPMNPENVIRRWIATIVGMQENNLADGIIKVDDDRFEPFGEAMSAKLKEAERLAKADRACLDAFSQMVKGGIGWVEVGDPMDVFDFPHAAFVIPWREMYWDTTSKRPDMKDAKWFRRISWYRREDLMEAFPGQREILRNAGTQADELMWNEYERYERNLVSWRDVSQWGGTRMADQEMLALTELRYRVRCPAYAFMSPEGRVVMFNEQNPMHMQMYQQGLIQPVPTQCTKVRQAYWCGPHLVLDRWCPVPNNEVGWVPFVCFQEELTGAPYGFVRDWIPLQDDVNVYRARAQFAMDSSTIIAHHNAAKNLNDARQQVNRRNGVVVLDGDRPNARFEIDRHEGITREYLEMYRESKSALGQVHGLDDPFAGTAKSAGQSGKAILELKKSSIAAIGGPLANYTEARQKVLSLLVDRLIAQIGDRAVTLSYKGIRGETKKVTLNVPVQLEDGSEAIFDPREIKTSLILDEVPSTATYREQQFNKIVDTLRSLSPEAQNMLLPALIEMSDLPNRKMYAEMAKKMLGQAEPQTPEEQQAAAEQAELAKRMQMAELAKVESKAKRDDAAAEKTLTDAEAVQMGFAKILAEIEKVRAETDAIRQDMKAQEKLLKEQSAQVEGQALYRF